MICEYLICQGNITLGSGLGLYLEPVPQGLPPIPGGYFRQSVDIAGELAGDPTQTA